MALTFYLEANTGTCIFAESEAGVFSQRIDEGERIRAESSDSSAIVVAVPTIANKYVYDWSYKPSGSTFSDYGHVSITSSFSSYTKPYTTTASFGPQVTVVNDHGTHYGTPVGQGRYGTRGCLAVQHHTSDEGWKFSGWKVTRDGSSDTYGIILSAGGTTDGTVTTFPSTFTDAVVVWGSTSSAYPITIEALYVSNHTITYDADGGSPIPNPQTAFSGDTINLAAAISKDNNNFLGWEIGGVLYAPESPYTMTENDVTATAIWTVLTVYTTTFVNADPNVSGTGPSPIPSEDGYAIILPGKSGWTNSGYYYFVGWATSSSGPAHYFEGDRFWPIGDTTLYGIWASGSGGMMAGQNYGRDDTAGWNANGTNTWNKYHYNGQYKILVACDLDLPITIRVQTRNQGYYHWTKWAYRVNYSPAYTTGVYHQASNLEWADGTLVYSTGQMDSSSCVSATIPGNYVYHVSTTYTPRAPSYQYPYDYDILTDYYENTVSSSSWIWQVVVPDGYEFLGWFSAQDSDLSARPYPSQLTRRLTKDATTTISEIFKCSSLKTSQVGQPYSNYDFRTYENFVCARFTGRLVAITFNPGVGSLAIVSDSYREVRYKQQYGSLPLVTDMAGYTFLGWFTESEGGTQILATTEVTNYNAHTIYAHWEGSHVPPVDDNTYVVSYVDVTGNNAAFVTTRTKGIAITLPNAPSELGWMIPSGYRINPIKTYSVNGSDGVATFYANAQSSVGDFPGSDTVYYITVNVLLIPITQTVTFDGNGGTVTPSTYPYVYGGKYGKFPVNPYYPGKRFLGWFTESIGGVEVTSTSSVTADETRTLYAHWEQGIRIPWTTCTFS